MPYTISKQFEFSAAHHLHLPDGHPCARVHGHNYTVEVRVVSDELDQRGMVIDFAELKPVGDFISSLDHQDLNNFLHQPTSENLARYIGEAAHKILNRDVTVRVSETPKTWAEWSK